MIALGPQKLYQAYGSSTILSELYEAMCAWLDKGLPRSKNGLWDNPPNGFQFADWFVAPSRYG